MVKTDEIKEYTIKELFEQKENYLIPLYQRNYAWKKAQVEQLVKDINDYIDKNKDYYIGTLVVFKKNIDNKNIFETIDGQQRLTTLSILLSVLKNKFKKDVKFNHLLKYESRDISTKTLQYIYDANIENNEQLNSAMKNAYDIIINYLKKDVINIDEFFNYLLNRVKILRVNVPHDTDLNHYFEIMNSRGEQLEKHEVLKARMLSKLTDNQDKYVFNQIWEACSDMYRYVQYGFSVEVRDKIFGDTWSCITYEKFDDIKDEINNINDKSQQLEDIQENKSLSIDEILDDQVITNIINSNTEDDKPDRFVSPINFQNFLLHVWKITQNHDITLDDKGLLDSIDEYGEDTVKKFGFNLLKLRFLFDNYIVKREYTADKDEWSLKQAYKYEYTKGKSIQKSIQYKNRFENESENKQSLMLISMFHVSNPSQTYKYWLTAVLNYLYTNYDNGIQVDKYIDYLEALANKFFKRYLSKNKVDYNEIIFLPCSFNVIDKSLLDQGTAVEHFIFNYLDYLLWKRDFESDENEKKFTYFNFSFSNSVEHFYPQHPIDGHKKLDDNILNSFGNLCLISVSKNAKLNNHPPKSKKEYYSNGKYDSLKQHIMMEKADSWNENEIKQHANDMKKILGILS